MADNTTLNPGSGGDTIASDDIGGTKHQRVKIEHGADGSATDVSTASPLPVSDAGGSITVDSADLASIKAAVEILDNIVAGSEAQVDVLSLPALPAGTNNIGDVDVLTLPALPAGTNNIGDVDVLTEPARAAATSSITAKLATDALHDGLTALTPKFAVIDHATSGDNTIVAAVASKKIRVVSLFVVAAAAVIVRFESGTGGTAKTGQMQLAANGGFVLPFNPVGWFETASGVLLNLELSAAVSVDGSLTYVEV